MPFEGFDLERAVFRLGGEAVSSIECVNVGDFIAVTSDRYQPEKFLPNAIEYEHQPEVRRVSPEPLKVVSVSAPFILCEPMEEKKPVHIDARFVNWTKLSEQYVAEYCRLKKVVAPEGVETTLEPKKPAEKCCPLCLGPMSERQDLRRKEKWVLVCKECSMKLIPIK